MTPTERAQVRQQHIADREVSGVSGSAYCKRHVMRHRYIRPSLSLPEIYLYRAPVDFRKQAQSLAVLVEQELGHNPFTGVRPPLIST